MVFKLGYSANPINSIQWENTQDFDSRQSVENIFKDKRK